MVDRKRGAVFRIVQKFIKQVSRRFCGFVLLFSCLDSVLLLRGVSRNLGLNSFIVARVSVGPNSNDFHYVFEEKEKTYLLTYWSFPLRCPLVVGWSSFCCVTRGLMVSLQRFRLLAIIGVRPSFLRSTLMTSLHLSFGLPLGVGPST